MRYVWKMGLEEKMGEWDSLHHAASKNELKPTLNRVVIPGDKAVIVPMGDPHIGSRYYDREMHREIVSWCLENNAYVIEMGDLVETATKDSVGAGVFEQEKILQGQLEEAIELLKPLAEKGLLLGMHPGNHEYRVFKHSGVDITKLMAKMLDVKYLGWGKLHQIRVGKENYMLYSTHGASGAVMPHTKIKAALRLADMVDAEIYCHAHLHQLSHHVKNFYRADLKNKTVVEAQKHFLLTGSFLNHWGSYAHMKAYEPMRKGSPKIKLSGIKHQIRVTL